jgi:hypothetical protein
MNYPKFFLRSGLFVPLSLWITLLAFMMFGMLLNYANPGAWFYSTLYSKISLSILALVGFVVIICQVKACWKD